MPRRRPGRATRTASTPAKPAPVRRRQPLVLTATATRMKSLARGGPKSPVYHANIPATCGQLPRPKVPYGVERRKRAAVHQLSGQRARPRRCQRLAKGRGLHRLPRRARDPARQRRQIADFKSSTFRPPAANAMPMWPIPSCRASTARPSRAATGWLRSAPTATASTPSRRPPIPIRLSRSRTFRATSAPAATRACGCRRSSAFPATASPATSTAITAWPRKAARSSPPTAPVAMACTTFCRQAIPAPPSTAPTSTPPAASVTKASRRSSPALRCISRTASVPETSTPSPCAGCGGFTFPSSCSSSAPCFCTTPSSGARKAVARRRS